MIFTADDIAAFQKHEFNLDDDLKNGDLTFAYNVFAIFLTRLTNRCGYVERLLEQDFELEREEEYLWKRKDEPWPANEREWDEVWRKKIKNEYVQRLVALELSESKSAVSNKNGSAALHPEAYQSASERDNALPPKEFVRKRYQQLMTVLLDSDSEWVLRRYLTAFAQAYDPHSDYMPPDAAEDFDIEMNLSLVGIGALLRAEDGAAVVERLIPGGPADRDRREKRLRPGDKIIAVAQENGEPVNILHMPLHKVVKLIRGEKGTRVILTVIPASDPSGTLTKTVDLVRDEVKLEEQAAKGRVVEIAGNDGLKRKLGVVTLPTFYASIKSSADAPGHKSSSEDVRRILIDLLNQGAEGILLDLRDNGGGSLVEAIKMAGLFIKTGPVVQVKERFTIRILSDNDPAVVYSGPLLMLVDRRSASASEIVAAALHDYGRAIVVGDSKTHGKGTVQTVLDVGRDPKLGALKVTTASYYRISGDTTQIKGVAPSIVLPSPYDRMEIGEEFLPNCLVLSRVPPAFFEPVGNLDTTIARLRELSEQRRKQDPKFTAYEQLLSRIEQITKSKVVPLKLSERRRLAMMEQELAEIEDDLDPEKARQNGRNEKSDVVLDEALRILADAVSLENQKTHRQLPVSEHLSFTDWLTRWLKEHGLLN